MGKTIWKPTCIDCGKPRYPGSAARCRVCYLAKAAGRAEQKELDRPERELFAAYRKERRERRLERAKIWRDSRKCDALNVAWRLDKEYDRIGRSSRGTLNSYAFIEDKLACQPLDALIAKEEAILELIATGMAHEDATKFVDYHLCE